MDDPYPGYRSRPCCGGKVQGGTICPPASRGRYAVQPGDTLFSIAWRFRISPDALVAANPHVLNWFPMIPGEQLCIPAAGS